jgi:hypothetical protein
MQVKKVVSKAQHRFFMLALSRIHHGAPPGVDMTEEELLTALDGVDYDSLPERAGQAAPKAKRQAKPKAPATPMPTPALPPPGELPPWMEPPPEALPDGVLSLAAYRAQHPEKVTPPADNGELARVLSFDGYLQWHPDKKRRGLSSKIGHEWFAGLFR